MVALMPSWYFPLPHAPTLLFILPHFFVFSSTATTGSPWRQPALPSYFVAGRGCQARQGTRWKGHDGLMGRNQAVGCTVADA